VRYLLWQHRFAVFPAPEMNGVMRPREPSPRQCVMRRSAADVARLPAMALGTPTANASFWATPILTFSFRSSTGLMCVR
jgi:hypothetical protein